MLPDIETTKIDLPGIIQSPLTAEQLAQENISCPVLLRVPTQSDLRALLAADKRSYSWVGLSPANAVHMSDVVAANGVSSDDDLFRREFVLLPEVDLAPRDSMRTSCGDYADLVSYSIQDLGFLSELMDSNTEIFVGMGKDGSGRGVDFDTMKWSDAVVVEFDAKGLPKKFTKGTYLGMVVDPQDKLNVHYFAIVKVEKDGDTVYMMSDPSGVFVKLQR